MEDMWRNTCDSLSLEVCLHADNLHALTYEFKGKEVLEAVCLLVLLPRVEKVHGLVRRQHKRPVQQMTHKEYLQPNTHSPFVLRSIHKLVVKTVSMDDRPFQFTRNTIDATPMVAETTNSCTHNTSR